MDTIEQIEKEFKDVELIKIVNDKHYAHKYDLQLRILIQIAKELRVLAQRSE